MQIPHTESIAVLDGSSSYSAHYGIAPEGKAPAGDYIITAKFGDATSEPVHLVIHPATLNINTTPSALLKWGTFYYQWSDLKKAEDLANRLLSLEPNSQGGLVLLGDVQFAANRFRDALATYQRALQLYTASADQSYEPPEYLMGMIAAAKARQ